MSGIYHAQLVGAAIAALGVSFASADVMEFEVIKLHFYQQISATPPATPLAYGFFGDLYADVGDATLITINGTPLFEEYPGEWSIEGEFASQAALDAAAPGPSFDFHLQGGAIGTRDEKVLLSTPELYPAAPALTPTSYNMMQSADASQALLIEWNPADASTDLIFLDVYSPKMDMTIIEAEMPAGQTSFNIPGGTLDPDETYEIEIAFGNGGVSAGHAFPGFGVQAELLSGYAAITIINLQTVSVGPGADIMKFEAVKLHLYEQLSASPPAAPSGYSFYSEVIAEPDDIFMANVNGAILFEEYPGEWLIEQEFGSQAALDAEFPGSVFEICLEGFDLGFRCEELELGPAIYPPVPALTPASYNSLQGADASQDILLEWNSSGPNTEIIFLHLNSTVSDLEIEAILTAGQTSYFIPGGTLNPDETYELEIAFLNGGFVTGEPNPGFGVLAEGLKGYAAITFVGFETVTVGPCDDVGKFVVVKGADYTQTVDNTPPAVPDTYFFDAFIDSVPGGIGSATINGIGSPVIFLFDFEGTGFWEANKLGIDFASKGELDATFPSSTTYSYQLSDGTFGTRNQSLSMSADNYPNIPFLVGTSYSDLQGMDAAQEITVNWAPVGPGASLVIFDLFEVESDSEVISMELDVSATSFTFPADMLADDTEYELLINFVNGPIIAGNNCPGFGTGSEGLAGFVNGTAVFFTTMGIDDSCVIPVQVGSADTSGTARDIAIVSNIAFVADDNAGLQIMNVFDPSSPFLLATHDTPSSAYGVFATGQIAYVADGGSGLQIVDVNDPSAPTPLGSYNTPNWAWDVTVVGGIAYVADGNSGLQIIDVSDPTSPSFLGAFDTSGTVRGVMVVGSTAYLADGPAGLVMVDVSDPTTPGLLGSLPTPSIARGLTIAGTTAYVVDESSGLQIIDVSDPTSPFLLGSFDTLGSAYGVSILGTSAHVADGSAGLLIIDVSDPTMPVELASHDTTGFTSELAISGEIAFLAGGASGMQIIDVTNTCVNLCPADLTGNGTLNFFDISAFLTAFANEDPIADFTGNGTFNFFDISAFLTAFGAGCP